MPIWTTPVDIVTDEVASAARLNAQIMEDLRFLFQPPTCAVKRSGGTESIANNTATRVSFDAEEYDTDSMHSTVTNNSRVTATTAGKYLITANANWASNTTGRRYLSIAKNNTTTLAQMNSAPVSGTGECGQAIVSAASLSAGDYVELEVYQNSGGSLDVTPLMQVTWVSG